MTVATLPRWRHLSAAHRRWVYVNAVLISGGVNLIIGGSIAWLMVHDGRHVPLWAVPAIGRPSLIVDTVATLFMLPFVTCIVFSTYVWREVRHGRLPPLSVDAAARPLGRLATGRMRSGLLLGVASAAALSPVMIPMLVASTPDGMAARDFTLFKALMCAALALLATPVTALFALSTARGSAMRKGLGTTTSGASS